MKTKTHISLFEKLMYGTGDIGMNIMYTLFISYALYYYTDVKGMNGATIGTVILVSRIFDGFSDIMAGQYIDTHKGRRGHCIPILMYGIIPAVISCVAVFLVPSTSNIVIQMIYVFITYNLFNTVLYTLLAVSHYSLASYVTDNSVERSQMQIYKQLFAAVTQMIIANLILPTVACFGGDAAPGAWAKTVFAFCIFALISVTLTCFFVKERVDNDAPPENIIQSIKVALKNKYWLLTVVIQMCCSCAILFNVSISLYYLKNVVGNASLMGLYVALCNIPGVLVMLVLPSVLNKVGKRNMVLAGTVISFVAQIVFCFAPVENMTILYITALLRGVGFAFAMSLVSGMTGDTIEYGEWKTGVRIQGVLFSAKSVGDKVAQGLLTGVFGAVLTAIGYDGLAEIQAPSAVTGINMFFRYVPILIYIIQFAAVALYKLDKEFPTILKELEERKTAKNV